MGRLSTTECTYLPTYLILHITITQPWEVQQPIACLARFDGSTGISCIH